MASILIISKVKDLQDDINTSVSKYSKIPGIYVSLNKTHESIEITLKEENIDTRKIFFIDCVTMEKKRDDVLHIHPTDLERLSSAINAFIKEIPGKKYLIIDALSTLLIYNDENKVAQLIKTVTEFASENEVDVVALSPETKGEDLLNKIYNFFSEVKGR